MMVNNMNNIMNTTTNNYNNQNNIRIQQYQPKTKRISMPMMTDQERRASIKSIMADKTISPLEKRRSIQGLMDGRRSSAGYGATKSVQPPPNTFLQSNESNNNNMDVKRMELCRPVCNHYERNCSIISPCCGAVYGCRLCHDESPVLPPPKYGVHKSNTNNNGRPDGKIVHRCSSLPSSFTGTPEPEETHHTIDRFAIREIICRKCHTRQSSKADECISCGTRFGEYHCTTCNLWMSAKDKPYHCDACGFCRIGGRENFKHCYSCGMCVDIDLYDNHNCNAGKFMSCCPVCQEDLFTSRDATHEMPCGHTIHWHCFQDLITYDSRCPICKKSIESAENLASTWSSIANSITMQPLPPDMAKVVNITCNDCSGSSCGRSWHFLGVQCPYCCSFNTTVDNIVMQGVEAAEFLGAIAKNTMNATNNYENYSSMEE